MITDQLVSFAGPGSNIPILAATVNTNPYDILGLGLGVTPAQGGIIIGNRTLFGADTGIGGVKPLVECCVGTAFTTGAGATLAVNFQGAIDDGTGNPSTYQTFMSAPGLTAAQLTAGTFFGRFDWPPAFPENFNPRFLRLQFVPSAAFLTGTVAFAMVTMGRPDLNNKNMSNNFVVAG